MLVMSTLSLLKIMIREEIQRNLRLSAGFYPGGLSGTASSGTEITPPGLGDEKKKEGKKKENVEEEEE